MHEFRQFELESNLLNALESVRMIRAISITKLLNVKSRRSGIDESAS